MSALAGQLTIYDELHRHADEGALRRLGDGPELGMVLLEPLFLRGWTLHRVRPFAGEPGWMFILANEALEVKRAGENLADVAIELFQEAAPLTFQAAA